jgi:phenylacetate-CoA ligase
MLKKLVWTFLATIADETFEKEYSKIKSDYETFFPRMLKHAYDETPYYNNAFDKAKLFQNNQMFLTNFKNVPVLTKDMVKREARDLLSRDYLQRKWYYTKSSGSTGQPLKFIQDRSFSKSVNATLRYYFEEVLGIKEAYAKKVLLWANQHDISKIVSLKRNTNHLLTNTRILDCLRMTEIDMDRYVRTINSYKPEVVRGYANALCEISRFAEKKKMTLHTPRVVITSAELLHDTVRRRIESAFGTRVFDFYGSREVDGIAGECKSGHYHMFMFSNYIEVLNDKNKNVEEGEIGRVVATNLHNYSMPFIRYDTGDMAILGPKKCACGNQFPTLNKIIGRVCCLFRKEDGTVIDDGYFMMLLAEKNWIKAFRIIQEDFKKVRILIVPLVKDIERADLFEIEEGIKLMLGKQCSIIWEIVAEIPKTKMGKYMYTQSLLTS